MIGNVARKKYEQVPDDAFVSQLATSINMGEPEHEAEIRKALPPVLTAIKKAEALLPPAQKESIRVEFLAYFKD